MSARASPAASVADQAYDVLRGEVLSGELGPDVRLTEVQLSERLGMSRTPVREAVKRMIHEGFMTRVPGDGLRVVSLGPEEIDQIFRIRLLLECHAAERAARNAGEDQVWELRRLADEGAALTAAVRGPDDEEALRRLSECNARFHRLIIDTADSPRIAATLANAIDPGLVLRTYRLYAPRDLRRSAAHHQEIADAIAARAPEWAASVMASHLHAAAHVAKRDDGAAPAEARPEGEGRRNG